MKQYFYFSMNCVSVDVDCMKVYVIERKNGIILVGIMLELL